MTGRGGGGRGSWAPEEEVGDVGGCVAALLDSAGLGGFAGAARLTKSEQPVLVNVRGREGNGGGGGGWVADCRVYGNRAECEG